MLNVAFAEEITKLNVVFPYKLALTEEGDKGPSTLRDSIAQTLPGLKDYFLNSQQWDLF